MVKISKTKHITKKGTVKKNPVKSGWTSEVPGSVSQAVINPLIQQMLGGSLTPAEVAQKQQDRILEVRKNGL